MVTLGKNMEMIDFILSRATYNQVTGCYQLCKEDYLSIKYSFSKRQILIKMCRELGIKIEMPFMLLPEIKCTELFDEYNNLRDSIQNCLNLEEKQMLEYKRIELRNIIVASNMELITELIDRRLNGDYKLDGITDDLDEDDLYQIGYESFIKYVDTHYLDASKLKIYMGKTIMARVRAISARENGVSVPTMSNLRRIKEMLLENNGNVSIEDIAKSLDIDVNEVKKILDLDNILNHESLDSDDCSELVCEDVLLENMYNNMVSQYIMKIIDTLPSENQKRLLCMYFGLNGEAEHSLIEIGEKLGIHRQVAFETKEQALDNFTHPIIMKYFAKVLDRDASLYASYDVNEEIVVMMNRRLRRLEKFLFNYMGKEEILELTYLMNLKYKRALLIYLGYGDILTDVKKQTNSEFEANKERGLLILRNKLTEKYIINSENVFFDNYFDYLMHNYFTRTRKK